MQNRRKLRLSERRKVYWKYGGHCAYCGVKITMQEMQVDHLIPLRLAGEHPDVDLDTMSNYMPACRSCNHYKSSLTLDKFRDAIERWPEVLERDSVTYRNAVRFGQVVPDEHPVEFYFESAEGKEWENGKTSAAIHFGGRSVTIELNKQQELSDERMVKK